MRRRIASTGPVVLALFLGLAAPFVAGASAFSGWTVAATPSPGAYGALLKGISARATGDVWAVGASAPSTGNAPLAIHWNGVTWSAVATPNPVPGCQDGNIQWAGNTLNGVTAVSATDAWAVGHTCYSAKTLAERWNGTTWSIVSTPSSTTGGDGIENTLNGVQALGSANVWAVGTHTAANGAFVTLAEHWNGSAWSVVATPSPSSTANVLNAVAGSSAGDVWAVGYQNGSARQPLIEHWNGIGWSVVPSPARPAGSVLNGVAVTSSSDAWAVGTQPGPSNAPLTLTEHWNGSSWAVVASPNVSATYGSENVLRSVTEISPTNVWAVGMFENQNTNYHQRRTFTVHWAGSSWAIVPSATPGASGELNAVTSLPTGQLWAGGLYSTYNINIYDGTYTAPRTLVLAG